MALSAILKVIEIYMKSYEKEVVKDPEFYIVKFTKNADFPYMLFIHGGPGLNCGVLEYLIEQNTIFSGLNLNVILYDQRSCGKSARITRPVKHEENVHDLDNIIRNLHELLGIKISTLVGHSYGAKLLFDYYQVFSSLIPGVFVSTARSILTPRLNNILLDLVYLKKTDPDHYNAIYNEISDLGYESLWEISKKLSPTFQKNKDRQYLYWANLEMMSETQKISAKINRPINQDIFTSVREDLYTNNLTFEVNIDLLKIAKLWINGFHDFVVCGNQAFGAKEENIIIFNKSAHYPHLEENERFTEVLNEFIQHI